MIAFFKAEFAHEVNERTQADGLGSIFPPPAPLVMGLAFSSIAGLRLRAPRWRRVVNTKL